MAILQKGTKLGVAVHHSVYTPAKNMAELKTQATLFNGWHSKKSWAETTKTPSAYPYISYHYLMATNGEMLNVTDEKYVKYHSGDSFRGALSFNEHGIAVCLTGNYENDKPTDAQMRALVLFIRDVEKRYKINARVRGHKETSSTATACPGKNIGTSTSGWLKQVIVNVNNVQYPPPAPIPTDPCATQKNQIGVLEAQIKALNVKAENLDKENLNLKVGKASAESTILKVEANFRNLEDGYLKEISELKEKASVAERLAEELLTLQDMINDQTEEIDLWIKQLAEANTTLDGQANYIIELENKVKNLKAEMQKKDTQILELKAKTVLDLNTLTLGDFMTWVGLKLRGGN